MKNVLLIGGGGFIGRHLKNYLEILGNKVDVFDKKLNTNINDEYTFTTTDAKYSHVVFLAAESNLRAVRKNPEDAIRTMTLGLLNSLRWYPDCHFTYISSSMVYGNWSNDSITETDPKTPLDLYGQLKLAGEGIVKELHKNYTIIRPTAVYGPDDDQSRVLPLFISKAKAGETLIVKGYHNALDFTHVEDIVQGIMLGMKSTGVFNISYGSSQRLENVARYICEKVNSGTVKVELNDFEYPRRGTMNIDKAKHELGYKPTKHIFQGIDELI